ncbi:Histidinol-phosphate/aromatic aminotransferase and cobyric acid decarboxylase [Treponema sp. JC4]|uniref:pyridoxal phosphate-dependent aminotransferase n=1 Tax=Treponema sp. JC4 TaxID=1124982 RepID=UPI00025B04AF|nr:aminotransferase class I/II-fold pyridoxal phosphate-dependent enzyme [Treponema sp. JC4]EID85696.1 Histidinol-phosphate/aromatic aminotransferase and cobyric acid decarboxylase [Treponema sp. JC4]
MHGGDIYSHNIKHDFSININPLGLPLGAKIAYLRALKKISNYSDQKCRALTDALSKKLGIAVEMLVFGNGASELIQAVLRVEKARRVLLFAPSFTGYEHAIKACGADSLYFYLNEKEDFAFGESDFDRLSDLMVREKPDFLILTNPNNPNGRLFNTKIVEKIIHLCNKYELKVLVDECFIDLVAPGTPAAALINSDAPYILRAFTKTYAIPGLRLGYCVCPNEAAADTLKASLPEWNVSSVAQEVGLALLKSGNYLTRARALIRREREYLSKRLKALGFCVYQSDANFILFRDVVKETSLFKKMLSHGILIRDCCDFEGLGAGFYRVAVKRHWENKLLIKAIKNVRGK